MLDGLRKHTIDLLNQLSKLARDKRSVAIKNWRVTSTDLTWAIHDNDLGIERSSLLGRVVLAVTGNISTSNVLDG
jgi:hypothetical protein